MSVNIFGASKTIGKGSKKGDRGIGFQLTADGDYDIDDKKLTNVAKPISENDATTKSYVDEQDENVKRDCVAQGAKLQNELLELTDRNMIHINGKLESIEGIEENVKRIKETHKAKLQSLNESHTNIRDNFQTHRAKLQSLNSNIRDNYVTKEKLVQTLIPINQKFDEQEEQLRGLENSRPKRDVSENIDQMFAQHQQKIEFLYNFVTQDAKVLSSELDKLFEEVKQIKSDVEENRTQLNQIWGMF